MNNEVTTVFREDHEELVSLPATTENGGSGTIISPDDIPFTKLPPIPDSVKNKIFDAIHQRFLREDVSQMGEDAMRMLIQKYQQDISQIIDDNVLDVLMPVQEGRYINSATTRSLDQQGYNWRLWVSTKHSDGAHDAARNNLKGYGISSYVLFLDNDLELPLNGIRAMVHYLEQPENENVACIVLHRVEDGDNHEYSVYDGTADFPSHVGMSCNLWRRDVLNQMAFTKRGSCECNAMCEDLRANGYEIGVLRGITCTHLKSRLTL